MSLQVTNVAWYAGMVSLCFQRTGPLNGCTRSAKTAPTPTEPEPERTELPIAYRWPQPND